MNFMAEAATRTSSSLASALLGVDDSFSAASARRVPCLHFTPPRRSARGAVETTSPGPGGQQVVVPRNTHGSRAERREAACLVREGGLHLLASLLLLRVLVSLSATLTWGRLATAGALDFSPASFYPELLPFVSLSVGKKYFSWYFHVLL